MISIFQQGKFSQFWQLFIFSVYPPQVQALDVSTVTELNKRYPNECGSLLSSSPILRFQIPNRKFAKPLTLTLPLPPNSTKLKRPQSVAPGSLNKEKQDQREQAAARPLSSIGFSMKEGELEVLRVG